MRVTTKITINMVTGEVLDHQFYEYDGPVALCCGATGEQKDTYNAQSDLMKQLTNQSQQIFGGSSSVFQDLINSFAPTVAAGPNQKGFSLPEEAALKSGAITNTGEAYKHASQAVRSANAAIGGGNEYLPGGAEIQANVDVANQGAQQTASALNQIDQANYATGRDNYFKAAEGLTQAPQVFNPSTSAGNSAVGAGSAAADTANQIAAANNSWVQGVTGALGGIAGNVVTGGMTNLGAGKGFFGGKKPSTSDAFVS